MPSDKELDQMASHAAEFRAARKRHDDNLTHLLEKFDSLLNDYKRVQSDYEEARDSRDRYKQIAKGQDKNPFVLVLVDGDGYIFQDDLIRNGTEGGQQAARLLDDAIKSNLSSRGLQHCRVMLRIYADLDALSKALAKVKLTGPEKRSLAPFVAGFNSSNNLYDFVDTGCADQKVSAVLAQFIGNPQCQQIYFAGCHNVGYLSDLTAHLAGHKNITLINTVPFHHQFAKLGCRVEDFPKIFRTATLETGTVISSTRPTNAPKDFEPSSSPEASSPASPCSYYQKGVCKYGSACRNSHVKSAASRSVSSTSNAAISKNWRQNSGDGKQRTPSATAYEENRASDDVDEAQIRNNVADELPKDGSIPADKVAVNRNNHRLDTFILPPSFGDTISFRDRVSSQKLCNNYHLRGVCPTEDCEYDHSAVSIGMIQCLKQVAYNNPCPRKGACRNLQCLNGHICQKPDCKRRGGSRYCRFGVQAHMQPHEVTEFVPGSRREELDLSAVNGSKDSDPLPPTVTSIHEENGEYHLLDFSDDVATNDGW